MFSIPSVVTPKCLPPVAAGTRTYWLTKYRIFGIGPRRRGRIGDVDVSAVDASRHTRKNEGHSCPAYCGLRTRERSSVRETVACFRVLLVGDVAPPFGASVECQSLLWSVPASGHARQHTHIVSSRSSGRSKTRERPAYAQSSMRRMSRSVARRSGRLGERRGSFQICAGPATRTRRRKDGRAADCAWDRQHGIRDVAAKQSDE
jgi:hypothetical protein